MPATIEFQLVYSRLLSGSDGESDFCKAVIWNPTVRGKSRNAPSSKSRTNAAPFFNYLRQNAATIPCVARIVWQCLAATVCSFPMLEKLFRGTQDNFAPLLLKQPCSLPCTDQTAGRVMMTFAASANSWLVASTSDDTTFCRAT
jgi:hypothetical protein